MGAPSIGLAPEHYGRIARLVDDKQNVELEIDPRTRFIAEDPREKRSTVPAIMILASGAKSASKLPPVAPSCWSRQHVVDREDHRLDLELVTAHRRRIGRGCAPRQENGRSMTETGLHGRGV